MVYTVVIGDDVIHYCLNSLFQIGNDKNNIVLCDSTFILLLVLFNNILKLYYDLCSWYLIIVIWTFLFNNSAITRFHSDDREKNQITWNVFSPQNDMYLICFSYFRYKSNTSIWSRRLIFFSHSRYKSNTPQNDLCI